MKVKIICELSEVFLLPQIVTEKENQLRFTKGVTIVRLDEENLKKLENYSGIYNGKIKIITENENINEEEIVSEMNKKAELKEKKAILYRELEEFKGNEEKTKKDIIEKFGNYITNPNVKKEELIKQIENNIDKVEVL